MDEPFNAPQPGKGVSVGTVALSFFILVGVCAVFFSLGFLVGYNEQSSKGDVSAERVTGPATIPSPVNSPLRTSEARGKGGRANDKAPISTAESPPIVSSEPLKVRPYKSATRPPASLPPPKLSASSAAAVSNPTTTLTPAEGEVGVGFAVQVAALPNKEDAERLVRILKARDYPVFLVTPEHSNTQDNLYRIQVGPFRSRQDAEKVRDRLVQDGYKPFIRH